MQWIPVTGASGGDGDLAWGQRFVWDMVESLKPNDEHSNVTIAMGLPARFSLEQLRAAIGDVVAATEALRTTYPRGANGPRQVVHSQINIPLTEIALAREDWASVHTMTRDLAAASFDLESDPPIRMGLFRQGPEPWAIAIILSHVVADALGLQLLWQSFQKRLAGESLPSETRTSRSLAREQKTPTTAARGRKSVEYWARQIDLASTTKPLFNQYPESEPRYWEGILSSPSSSAAAARLSRAWNISEPTLLMSAFALAMRPYAVTPKISMLCRVANRPRNDAVSGITHLGQEVPLQLGTECDDLKAFAEENHRTALRGYRHGQYDPVVVSGILSEAELVYGGPLFGYRYNCVRFVRSDPREGESLVDLRARSQFSWGLRRHTEVVYSCFAVLPGDSLSLYVDTRFIPKQQINWTLMRIEDSLVEAAACLSNG